MMSIVPPRKAAPAAAPSSTRVAPQATRSERGSVDKKVKWKNKKKNTKRYVGRYVYTGLSDNN